MLAVLLFLLLRPESDDGAATAPTTTTSARAPSADALPTATAAAPPPTRMLPEPTAVNVRLVVEGGRPQGGPRRLNVAQGRTVLLTVEADAPNEVHVHGYDVSRPVSPRQPTRIRFVADMTGRFEIELERTHVLIAELEVRP
jgi:hypothetical protein